MPSRRGTQLSIPGGSCPESPFRDPVPSGLQRLLFTEHAAKEGRVGSVNVISGQGQVPPTVKSQVESMGVARM